MELKRFIQDEKGATAIEYAFMLVLPVVAVVATVVVLGKKNNKAFNTAVDLLKIIHRFSNLDIRFQNEA